MHTRHCALLGIAGVVLLAVAFLWLGLGPVRAQNPAEELFGLINSARLDQGLHPYVVSDRLREAAQRHSDDMADSGQIGHTGSDGSSSTERILATGYGVYGFGLVASENIYVGTGGPELPFSEWLNQAGARSNLLHDKYREVGIGTANDDQGQTFWTITFGAQPNVLPVLINDGVTSADTVSVTLRLVPENVAPDGQGTAMGQPVDYRASISRQFLDAEWRLWAEEVSFELDEAPGEQTVYVQLRDAGDRTTISQAAVTLTGEDVTVTPSEVMTLEASGTPAVARTATVTPTQAVTSTLTLTPQTSPTPTGTTTATVTGTATPRPTPTASSTPAPTLPATGIPVPTDIPTRTAPPKETETKPPPTVSSREGTAASPTPLIVISEEEFESEDESDPLALASRLVPWAVGLQIIALILGVYVALRRPGE